MRWCIERNIYTTSTRASDAVDQYKVGLDTLSRPVCPEFRKPALLDFEQMRTFGPASAVAKENMDSLFVPFRCVASDLTDQSSVVFSRGNLAEAIRASMSYPFYFKPITVNGHLMMDGGLYNNFPSDVMYNDFLPDLIFGSNVSLTPRHRPRMIY